MKLFLSVLLGLLAALFAAVLVGALASGPEGTSALSLGTGQVAISTAAIDLDAGHVLTAEDVREQNVSTTVAGSEGLLSKRSVVGRVLIRPLVSGQAIARKSLAGSGTGPEIESMLADGYRATTVTLSDSGPGTFVYPGSVVDVIAVFEMPKSAPNAGEMVSRTVIEGAQVLAVDGYADAAKQAAQSATARKSSTSRGPIITLLLTPNQAQVLQLARNLGSLSVTLRSNDDQDLVSRKTVSMSELLKYQPVNPDGQTAPVAPVAPIADATGRPAPSAEGPDDASSPPALQPAVVQVAPQTRQAPSTSADADESWEMIVIRGGNRSTYTFEEDE